MADDVEREPEACLVAEVKRSQEEGDSAQVAVSEIGDLGSRGYRESILPECSWALEGVREQVNWMKGR